MAQTKEGIIANRPKSGSYGEEYFATDTCTTYVYIGDNRWTSRAAFEDQQKRLREERLRREFERDKRDHPWWYEDGHHICGDIDGH